MLRIIFLVSLLIVCIGKTMAQDTIVLHGQPNWKTSLDIANQSSFFEEKAGSNLSFDEIKKQVFVPYKKELRKQRLSNRPLIIQWHKFIISNTSATDPIQLRFTPSPHYFTRLYSSNNEMVIGGAYETRVSAFERPGLPFTVAPLSTVTFWARMEDRQNQLVTPGIELDTPYTFADKIAKGRYLDRYLYLMLALLAGCLSFISVYAMFQYYLYRDTSILWYIAYTIGSLITVFFWMDIRMSLSLFPAIVHDLMLSIFLFLVPVLYSLFIGSMLQLPVHFKKGWLIVKVLIVIMSLQMLIGFTATRTGQFMFNPEYYGYFESVIPIVALHLVLLTLTAFSKERVKWFLFVGLTSLLLLWCFPVMGFIVDYQNIYIKSPELFMIFIFPPAFLILGLTIEAVCFSFALSYKSKLVLIEKNKLQQNYAVQLQEQLAVRTKQLQEQNLISEAQKLKQVETAFEQKIAETEMTALRAQMNPHFIFNCLNSIKLYTLENDSQTASEYLTMFSQLIRLVLENSRSEKVTLQNELETLRLYIELEAMRFKNKVQYQINVSPGVDQQYIEVPPLLLQPYVENAIWHGLMHRKDGGCIMVDVSLPAEHLLYIEITDDGVGRELAAEYKSKSATRQKSFGLKMTSDRLNIINQLYQIHADVKINDLKDAMNNATGTRVIIQIPV